MLLLATSCASSGPVQLREKPSVENVPYTPPPDWALQLEVSDGEVCGIGIAGRVFQGHLQNAIDLATERAIKNLAGTLESSVIEAQIVHQTESGASIEHAIGVSVDEATIERVAAGAKTDTWYDVKGEGAAGEVGFTYARSCISADVAASQLKIGGSGLEKLQGGVSAPDVVPEWLSWVGSNKGARLCAVGYRDPGFFTEGLVEGVVEDVRGQLVTAAESVVMSAFDEDTTCKEGGADCTQSISELTAAATEAVSRGVVVTHFWFDRNGIGPRHRKKSVYGWGCVYARRAVEEVRRARP